MEKNDIKTENAPKAIGPYSQGMVAGQFVYTSGQLPIVPETGELIKDDIQRATRQSLENLKNVLKEGGAKLEDVVKVTVFIKDMAQFKFVNEVYSEYFVEHKPARSCVEVSKLPLDGDIEIEAIAII